MRAASRTSMSAFAPSAPTRDPGRRDPPPRLGAGLLGVLVRGHGAAEARLAGAAQRDPDARRRGDLDRRPARLAVALREVRVAERQQRALDVDGEVQAAPDGELADVEVAAVLARRDRPQALAPARRPAARRRARRAAAPPRPARPRAPSRGSAARATARPSRPRGTAARRSRRRAAPSERATPSAMSQRTSSGSGKRSASSPKPGMTAVVPTASQSSASSSTTSTSPGRAPRTATGPVSGWLAPRSTSRSASAEAARRSSPSIPSRQSASSSSPGSIVATGAMPGCSRLWAGPGSSARIEASRSRTRRCLIPRACRCRAAARRARPRSSGAHSRVPPSTWTETMPTSRSPSRTAVTICAESPP